MADVNMTNANEELLDYEEENPANQEGATQRPRHEIKVSAVGRRVVVSLRDDMPVLLKAHYVSRLLQQASPTMMVKEAIISQLIPELAEALPDFSIAWSYDQQLKPTVLNARAIMTAPFNIADLAYQLCSHTCSCSLFVSEYKVQVLDECIHQHAADAYGSYHIRTTDLSIISDPALRELLAKGLNHVPTAAADVDAVIAENVGIAQQFMARIVEPTAHHMGIALAADAYDVVCESAAAWTQTRLAWAWEDGGMQAEFTTDVERSLHELQKHLHICEVDKAANTCCLMCPEYAQLLVALRLQKSADFELIPASISDIATELKGRLESIDTQLGGLVQEGQLPIMRIAFKAHKNDYRYLTNASNSLLSGLNSLAQGMTSCIMEGVQGAMGALNKRIQGFSGRVHTQAYIVVQNAQQVALNMPDRVYTDFCADISKCFEAIPVCSDEPDNLPQALGWAVTAAFKHMAGIRRKPQILAVVQHGEAYRAQWQHASSMGRAASRIYLTEQQTIELLTLAVTNAYITAGGVIYKQAKGIPMGANYSPDACNLYFIKYECAAILRMCRLASSLAYKQQLCSEWLHSFRMMDDIRMVNAPTLAGFLKNPSRVGDANALSWIYPACVGIDVTFDVVAGQDGATQSTQYLDMLTHIYPDATYDIEVYDKQQKLPFTPVHYIALASNRHVGNNYKLLLGQAHRVTAICTTPALAAKHIAIVIKKMAARGFRRGRLMDELAHWATNNPAIPGKTYTMTDVINKLNALPHQAWRH